MKIRPAPLYLRGVRKVSDNPRKPSPLMGEVYPPDLWRVYPPLAALKFTCLRQRQRRPGATRGKGRGGKDGEYSEEGKLVVAQALRGDFIVRCAHQGMGVNILERLRPALGFFVRKELSYVREAQFQHGYGYGV